MGNKASIQSLAEGKGNRQIPEVSKGNDWADDAGESAHNGWGPAVGSTIKDHGWLDKPAEALHNGWGESASKSIAPLPPEVRSNGWMDEAGGREYQGWGSDPAKHEFNGWLTEPVKDDYNGWGVRQDIQTECNIQHFICPDEDNPSPSFNPEKFLSKATSSVPMTRQAVSPYNSSAVDQVNDPIEGTQKGVTSQPCSRPDNNNPACAPSAPPIPDEFLHEEVNSWPIESNTRIHEATVESGSSSCIICWEYPVEGACVPCGHMAGCMSCLNEIKSKKGDCPICRVKIGQVIKLYAV